MSYFNIVFIFDICRQYCEELGFEFEEIVRNIYNVSINGVIIAKITRSEIETVIGDYKDFFFKIYQRCKQFDTGELLKRLPK